MARKARPGTGNALAKRLGVVRQRVSQLKKQGRVKMIGAKIDVDASERMHQQRLAAQQPSKSRQMKHKYEAKMAKLEYEKAMGLVIDKGQVEKDAFRLARIVRDALMRLPDRLAGVLASEKDQNKIHAMLTKEIRQILEALSVETPTETAS